jgi:hypothetical protein
MDESALADGWTVWNEGTEKVVLAYRPDVFDGDRFDPGADEGKHPVEGVRYEF